MLDAPSVMARSSAMVLAMAGLVACGPTVTEPTSGGQGASEEGAGSTSPSGETGTTRATVGTPTSDTTSSPETTVAVTSVDSGDPPVDLPPSMCTTGDAVSVSAMLTPAGSYPATHGLFRWVACCPTQLTLILLLDGVAPGNDATPRLVLSFDEDELTGIHPAYAELFTAEETFEAVAEVDVVAAVTFPDGANDIVATVAVVADGWDFQAEVTLPHCVELDIFCPC